MKKLHVIFAISLISLTITGQNWEWAKSVNFPYSSFIRQFHASAGKDGAFYISGYNWDQNYGRPAGSCIISFDQNGDEKWRKLFTEKIRVLRSKSDNQGNLFLAGDFIDTVNINGTQYSSPGNADGFLCRLDTNGNFTWFHTLTGQKNEHINDIFIDHQNNLYITGLYSNNSSFNGSQLNTIGEGSTFVIKLEPTGNVLSVITSDDTDTSAYNYGCRIKSDLSGGIYVLGEFISIQKDTYSLYYGGSYSSRYFTKLDQAGNAAFLKEIIHGTETFKNFCVTDDGYYFTGDGGWTWGGWKKTQKYSLNMDLLWSKRMDGFKFEYSSDNIVPNDSGFYTVGIEGDPNVPAWHTTYSLMLTKYSTSGDENIKRIESKGLISQPDIITLPNQSFIIAGIAPDTISFGDNTLTKNNGNVFIAKFNDRVPIGIAESEIKDNILIYPNPTTGELNIQIPFLENQGEICFYDGLGNCVLTQEVSSVYSSIDLRDKAKGIFLVRVKTEKGNFSKKIVLN